MDVDNTSIAVDEYKDPVKVKEEDFPALREIQVRVDTLAKYRQEIGRLFQLLGNLRDEANRIEVELSEKRRSLAHKYNLEQMGAGQWALDFEAKEFIKTAPGSPVIP